ncbi:BRO1 domain-containing protein brox [Clonorchis sinensis]|uniref:BRO1 domain-containing protein brox n=1 Tax=Clonorchis sinensis TaxID=79923 RepID=A0A8T1LXR2_CLOSI|nr:BRO1 domain-containing protein brox [Clonorchis sinensis]
MSNWFHRNPLKATSKITFDLGVVAESLPARSICHDLASNRMNLLKLLVDPAVTTESVLGLTQQYISLLMGFVEAPSNQPSNDSSNEPPSEGPVASNKLRNMVMFKWSNSAEPKNASPIMEPDALFEVCSMLYNVALWLTKHAAKLSAKDEVSTDEAKEVHTSLRHAAGLIQLIRDKYVSKLNSSPKPGDDLCADVMEAYIHQSVAEAQEVTLARAIELKHDPSLIAGLAKETSNMYQKAALSLKLLDAKVVGKWLKYLEFKKHCYETCAYVYFAEQQLKIEKAGAGLAIIAEAEKAHKLAIETAKMYGRTEGVGLSAKMAEHCFFRRLGIMIENTRRKLERENCMIFHQRVPPSVPVFDLKAQFGVVEPQAPEMDLSVDQRWKEAYKGFNEKKVSEMILQKEQRAKDHKTKSDRTAPVEHVHEKPIFSTDKDPKNESGCVLS